MAKKWHKMAKKIGVPPKKILRITLPNCIPSFNLVLCSSDPLIPAWQHDGGRSGNRYLCQPWPLLYPARLSQIITLPRHCIPSVNLVLCSSDPLIPLDSMMTDGLGIGILTHYTSSCSALVDLFIKGKHRCLFTYRPLEFDKYLMGYTKINK